MADVQIDPTWWASAFTSSEEDEWIRNAVASRELQRLAEVAEPGTLQHRVLKALSVATSVMLDPSSWTDPFKPWAVWDGRRTAVPSDLTSEELAALAACVPFLTGGSLRARAADIAWTYGADRTDRALLDAAITGYTSAPLATEAWLRGAHEEWLRAVELGLRRGRDGAAMVASLRSRLRDHLLQEDPGAAGFASAEIGEVLRKCGAGPEVDRRVIAENFVDKAEHRAREHPRRARRLEREAIAWFRLIGDEDEQHRAMVRIASSYEQEADDRLAGTNGQAMAAGGFFQKAIAALRSLPRSFRRENGLDERIADLQGRLDDARELTLESMVPIEMDPVDITEMVSDAQARVAGLGLLDALMRFCAIAPLNEPDRCREQAQELMEGSLARLFPTETYARDRRKVHSSSGGDDDDALWHQMVKNVGLTRGLLVQGRLLPAKSVIDIEHRVALRTLHEICHDSPVIPPNHVDLWARGLLAGFDNDLPAAVSILAVQLEQLVRWNLKRMGVHTLVTEPGSGVETEKGLNAFLDTPEATAWMGEDLCFEMKALLVEQAGDNLRNEVAHGLLDDAQAWSASSLYLWWLCLRFAVIPVWNMRQGDPVEEG